MKPQTATDYLEQEFPKGKTRFRGQAMVLLALAQIDEKNKILELLNSMIDEIRSLPNRDDKIYARLLIADGGGVNRFEIIKKIDDLIKQLEDSE